MEWYLAAVFLTCGVFLKYRIDLILGQDLVTLPPGTPGFAAELTAWEGHFPSLRIPYLHRFTLKTMTKFPLSEPGPHIVLP